MRHFLTDLFSITTAELEDFFEVRDQDKLKTETKKDNTQTEIELELPGVKKEDIKIKKINFNHYDSLIVSGKTRRGIEFTKTYYLSESDVNNIKAEYKDGILRMIIPKRQVPKPTEHEIKIE